ncbi:MAG TPA: hypothetical protein VMP03_04070 [Methylomirabilota bacterium]|nr:hypothetical protein [Methylomirabilota bacterium]
MIVAAISGNRTFGADRRPWRRKVEACVDSARADGSGDGDDASASRAVVAVKPRPSVGARVAPGQSSPFMAQLAATHLGHLPTAERRVTRLVEHVAPRADAAYRTATRLATEIEPGFLVKREF